MAFIIESGSVTSFAEYSDAVTQDQRLFLSNESLTDDYVEPLLIRATERILTRLRASSWWRSYFIQRDTATTINTVADIPALDADRILARQDDFTDLCVFVAFSDYILPGIADFGDEANSERQKMGYYKQRGDELIAELITAGDWYDFDNDSTIDTTEKQPGQVNLKRVR